jgi:hypothetical protein
MLQRGLGSHCIPVARCRFSDFWATGPTNVLYFAAGPDDETNGYFGKIEVAP